MSDIVKVLVVDDSAFMRKMISQMIAADSDLHVIGQARNGIDALDKAAKLSPDVITLDVEMPEMDGITALKAIQSTLKIPVVMLSSVTTAGAATTLRCLEMGAVDFVAKPSGAISLDIEAVAKELVAKVKVAARSRRVSPMTSAPRVEMTGRPARKKGVVVIGASTGGPRALQSIIPLLPGDLKIPIVIVQHMPATFTATLAARLNELSNLEVKEAEPGDRLLPGQVLVAPGGFHMEFDSFGRTILTESPTLHGVRPAIDITLSSLVRTFNSRMVGVILTGMGVDGAAGLKSIRDAGGFTIAECQSTCVVYGMPKAAAELDAVDRVVPLGDMAKAIVDAVAGESNFALAG